MSKGGNVQKRHMVQRFVLVMKGRLRSSWATGSGFGAGGIEFRVANGVEGRRATGATTRGKDRVAGSGPSAASLSQLGQVRVKNSLLVGGQHRAHVLHLVAEQPPNLLPRGGVGRTPGREGRHLFAIVLLDRIDFRLLLRRQSDAFEQQLRPPLRTTARRTLSQRRRRAQPQRGRAQQCNVKPHGSPPLWS